MLNLILVILAIGLAIAPFVVVVETAGWAIGQHSFPDGGTWAVAGLGVLFWILLAAKLLGAHEPSPPATTKPPPKRKRYVMRGYGGGKNTTSVHPRQQKRGKTIVYIPGVGYRHVQKRRSQ